MELLALAFLWPLLFLAVGVVFISASDISGVLLFPIVILFLIFIFGLKERLQGASQGGSSGMEDVDRVRRGIVAFSIALFLPIFARYLLTTSGNSLPAMIIALMFGFGILLWGVFTKGNKVLTYANIIGGSFVIVYLYSQLWSLGEFPRIVAAAFGLVVAVVVSVIKFREKLT